MEGEGHMKMKTAIHKGRTRAGSRPSLAAPRRDQP